MLTLAKERLTVRAASEALSESLVRAGVTPMDALHAALASTASADFFATTDDRLLRKLKSIPGLTCQTMPLLALVSEVTK